MRKRDELSRTDGCMAKALDHEMTFVLLARDPAAPVAIRAWIGERLRIGKNHPGDPLVVEAEQCAATMERERESIREAIPNAREAGEPTVKQSLTVATEPTPEPGELSDEAC